MARYAKSLLTRNQDAYTPVHYPISLEVGVEIANILWSYIEELSYTFKMFLAIPRRDQRWL